MRFLRNSRALLVQRAPAKKTPRNFTLAGPDAMAAGTGLPLDSRTRQPAGLRLPEGVEFMMLQGATQTLKNKPIWLTEITTDQSPPQCIRWYERL